MSERLNEPRFIRRQTGASAFSALLASAVLAIGGCTSVEAPRTEAPRAATGPITLLAFGDSGYHYDYLEPEQYETVVTEEQFLEAERLDWIEDRRPIEELAFPPTYRLPGNGSVIDASGLEPVSKAMKSFCANTGCDFAVMLGDNIYPNGATANADGRDAERFRDLFVKPFSSLGEGREDFRIYAVLGNHDWRTSRAGALAQVEFLQKTPPFYMDGIVYRAKPAAGHGDIEIFAIDTEVLLASTTVYEAILAEDASEVPTEEIEKPRAWTVPQSDLERNMAAWLEQALRSSTARWKIVIGHHPLWSTSGGKFQQARALRRLILPTLCRYAHVYVAGHEHTLEVHTDDCSATDAGRYVEPLPQIVSGSASKMRPTNSAFIRHQLAANPQLRTLYAKGLTWGFAHLTFEGDMMKVQILEVPTDGSGLRVAFEHSFPRRRQRSAD
ncbi:MAG TPA: metallophosphoesterase [Steroidobacter sp.]